MLIGNQSVIHNVTEPKTGIVYTFEAKFGESGVEIDILHHGIPKGNVLVEVYNGKSQVVIANAVDLEKTGGDNPKIITLFEQH